MLGREGKSKVNLENLFTAICSISFFFAIVLGVQAFGFTQPLNQTSSFLNTTLQLNNVTHLKIDNTRSPYDHLVLYYAFDGDLTNNTAYDWSGNDFNASYSNANISSSIFGNGIKFLSSGGYLNSGKNLVDGLYNFSTCAWYKSDTANVNAERNFVTEPSSFILTKRDDVSQQFQFLVYNETTSAQVLGSGHADTNWHHVCGTYNGTLSLYVDGASEGTSSDLAGPVRVSASDYLYLSYIVNGFFNATVDELMVFNSSLTQAQIQLIYTNQSQRFFKTGNLQTPAIAIGTGNIIINVSLSNININKSTNVSVRVYNNGDGTLSSYKNTTQNSNTTHSISSSATIINVNVTLLSDQYGFYSPILYGNITTDFTNLAETTYPSFSSYSDNTGALIDSGTASFSVSVSSTNGTVLLQINNTNYTASNLTPNVFNVSIPTLTKGTYSYVWLSWGNGSNHNFNTSTVRSYTVNATPTTLVSASCNQIDVQATILNASEGDIIRVPSGNCSWASGIIINKSISVIGSNTTLTATTALADGFFHITGFNSTLLVRVSNFTFFSRLADIEATDRNIHVSSVYLTKLRIDHNTFYYGYESIAVGGAMGVIDHNTLYDPRKGVDFNAGSRAQADASWANLDAGSANALFIEDNHFINDANYPLNYTQEQIGTENGGKLVIRYNEFNFDNTPSQAGDLLEAIQTHGSADGGCEGIGYWEYDANTTPCARRGQSVVEVYNNVMHGRAFPFMATFRGSANLVWGNTLTINGGGGASSRFYLREEESSGWVPNRTQWPAEDQVHNSFFWNNTFQGIAQAQSNFVTGDIPAFIQENRDYFLHAPCHINNLTDEYGNNCTYGNETFVGLNGASNSSPTDGITYPTLGTMVFNPNVTNAYYGYVPYTYPHPLVTLGSVDTVYPTFTSYADDSGNLINSGTANFNVSVASTNGTVLLYINGQNYTASNSTATKFSVSVSLSSGTYNYLWYSFGSGGAHNLNSSAPQSYFVDSSGNSDDEDSSGGGGAGAQQTTELLYTPTDSQLEDGYTRKLKEGDRIKMNIDDDEHTLTVDDVQDNYVELTVRSSPQKAIINVGEQRKFNLDNDGTYDLLVMLTSIKNSAANITVRQIDEEIPATSAATNKGAATNTATTNSSASEPDSKESKIPWLSIVSVIVVIAIISVLFYTKNSRKKKYGY